MDSHNRRGVARLPHICSRPKRRHAKFPSAWVDEGNIENDFIKRVAINAARCEGQLDGNVRFRSQARLPCRRGKRHCCPEQKCEEGREGYPHGFVLWLGTLAEGCRRPLLALVSSVL